MIRFFVTLHSMILKIMHSSENDNKGADFPRTFGKFENKLQLENEMTYRTNFFVGTIHLIICYCSYNMNRF